MDAAYVIRLMSELLIVSGVFSYPFILHVLYGIGPSNTRLDTAPDSPGFKAGLVPLKDWIIGSVDLALQCEDDFYQLLIHNKKRPVKLVVFNMDSNECREVAVVPDFEWGGDGWYVILIYIHDVY